MQYLLFLIFCFSLNSYGGEIEGEPESAQLKIKVSPFLKNNLDIFVGRAEYIDSGCREYKILKGLQSTNDQKLKALYDSIRLVQDGSAIGLQVPSTIRFEDIISTHDTEYNETEYYIPIPATLGLETLHIPRANCNKDKKETYSTFKFVLCEPWHGCFNSKELRELYNKYSSAGSFFSSTSGKVAIGGAIVGGVIVLGIIGRYIIYPLWTKQKPFEVFKKDFRLSKKKSEKISPAKGQLRKSA